MTILLYDYKRDGIIPLGMELTVYDDGHTELRKQRREYGIRIEPTEFTPTRPRNIKRSGLTRTAQHHKANLRPAPVRKSLPLHLIKPSQPLLFEE
jgi:hypothetical protein